MQTYASLFERKLNEFIEDEVNALRDQAALGGGIETIEDYRRLTGMIAGLRKAQSLFDDARKAAEER